MPTKTANNKTTVAAKTYDVQFVRCELDKATKEQVKSWDSKYERTFDGLARLIDAGYKVSLAHDNYHDCCAAFCTMSDKSHDHNGFCLTARGPNILDVLKVLIFKHYNVLGEHWDTEVNHP
jgi:hypothetical protein